MVARRMPSGSGLRALGTGLAGSMRAWFLTWRSLLTAAFRLPVESVRASSYRPRPSLVYDFLRSPETTVAGDADAPPRLSAFGVRAFVSGTLLMIALAVVTGGVTGVAVTRALTGTLWAVARLLILLMFAPRGERYRSAIATAWAIGLVPYLFGVTSILRIAAFLASAVYTDAALNGVGIAPQRSRPLVTKAFGAQGVVVGASWALRAVVAAFIAMGSAF